ncbi:alpha/beta hydrolase [Leifsonia sp. YIM 134122]|uniref:Alpha/beta hydrolase n=1 Tax=Leifsonia stereocauli TaxID=3134136 RepID=A0ABU9W6P3_9MICO
MADLHGQATRFSTGCAENTGELLRFVDTESAARDLDILRAALGESTLDYLGFSYGTLLGATYADLFPHAVGRMVLDGAVDPTITLSDIFLSQAEGYEGALRAAIAFCLDNPGCPFDGTAEDAAAQIRLILDTVEDAPLEAQDGRLLDGDNLTAAMKVALYRKADWPYLFDLLESVSRGFPALAFRAIDSSNSRSPKGEYTNSVEAGVAIQCLDFGFEGDSAAMAANAAAIEAAAPVLGTFMTYREFDCVDWPHPPAREPAALHAAGSAPIMVIGTTNDPATPYAFAQSLAGQLSEGRLVTFEGEGHTAYPGTDCIVSTVDGFLVDGTMPAVDPRC